MAPAAGEAPAGPTATLQQGRGPPAMGVPVAAVPAAAALPWGRASAAAAAAPAEPGRTARFIVTPVQGGEPEWAKRFSVPCGTLRGIPVRLHGSLLLVVLVVTVVSLFHPSPGLAVAFHLLIYGPVLLGTVLVHELGHCFAARRVGGEAVACSILLWPLGGLAFVGDSFSPLEDLQVALAGPLTHVPMFLGWMLAVVAAHPGHRVPFRLQGSLEDHFGLNLLIAGMLLNLSLFLFNLLVPAFPLDGGRILADALLLKGLEVTRAAQITATVAVAVAGAIFLYGFIFFDVFGIMVAVYVVLQAVQLFQFIQHGLVHLHPLFFHAAQTQQRMLAGHPPQPQPQRQSTVPNPVQAMYGPGPHRASQV